MPRPKVKPEDRQRCVLACLPCKRLKIRCDARTPCSTCIKRGREDGCVYQDLSDRKAPHGRKRRSTVGNTGHGGPSSQHQLETQHDGLDTQRDESPEESGPQSRTLLSSKFQKLYIGESASLSYLQFVRDIVEQTIGTNAFSEGEFSSFMLESDVKARTAAQGPIDDASNHLEPVFVQSYLDAVRHSNITARYFG